MEPYEDDGDHELPFCLTQCENIFHANCLTAYFEIEIKDGKLPIVCPDAKCKEEIADSDLRDLLTGNVYKKYTETVFNLAVD